jgi:hypothetical protein
MKLIQTLVIAGLAVSMAVPAMAASAKSPIHVNNRLRLGYDDNIYQVDSPSTTGLSKKDSFRIIEEIEVLVSLNMERTYLGLRYRPSLIWYSDRDNDDTDFLHDMDLNFSHTFTPTLVAVHQRHAACEPAAGAAGRELHRARERRQLLQRGAGDLVVQAASGDADRPLGPPRLAAVFGRLPGAAQQRLLQLGGRLTVRQQLASLTTLMGDLRYQTVVYDEADADANRDAESVFAGLGLEQTFSPQLIGNLRAGVESRSYDDDRFDDNTQPYGEVSLTFLPSPSTRITGAAAYSIYESDVARYLSQNRTYLSLSLAHDFTAKLSFYLSGAYAVNAYEADYALDALPDADETSYLISMRLSYRVNRINWLEAGYQFVALDSDVMGRESYERNRFDIGWKIQLF